LGTNQFGGLAGFFGKEMVNIWKKYLLLNKKYAYALSSA